MSNAGFFVIEAEENKTIKFDEGWMPELHPSGALGVVEMVPDLANKNNGNPIPELRMIYGVGEWKKLIMATPQVEAEVNNEDD